ncbi:MAG: zinc ribbon domain-containing protein [Chloroflexota bacterium]|nr:zinc ribbon domain-containing protein [Chloroflexota bacterium]MDE2843472.1 zinc ribbon domain-containing protein [Chloroflexota bacterium]
MPIYEYYCATCNVEYEAIRPASRADEPVPCKTCDRPGERQLSTFSFKSNTFTAPKLKPAGRPKRSYSVEEDEPSG